MSHSCTDHLGRSYSSEKAMCEAHNICYTTYKRRVQKGLPLEKALSTERYYNNNHQQPCTDHLGNKYDSITQMCQHYGVTPTLYTKRLERGKTKKEALTPTRTCIDHQGNEYPSFAAMARAYGQTPSTVQQRIDRGVPLEDALTKPSYSFNNKNYMVQDHLGNVYANTQEMCDAYHKNINTFWADKRNGMGLEESLTRTGRWHKRNGSPITDHLGNQFRSEAAMCKKYKVKYITYRQRRQRGWELKEALLTPGRT